MKSFQTAFRGYLVLAATVGLAAVLLVSALLTYRKLDEMQRVYLRDQAARIAARLETMRPDELARPLEAFAEEPGLVGIEVFSAPGDPRLAPLWNGRELFRIEWVTAEGQKMFRAYIPFHSQARLCIVRIDLAITATDFLMTHAARNLLLASVTGLVLLGLAVWGMYSTRRQMELEHLAHLGTMSAVLAHEIRNPLGTIKGFVQLAGEQAGDSAARLLAPVLGEVRRLERLVSDLLQYAKPREPALRSTEWRTLAAEIEAYARDAIGDRPAAFRWDGEPWRFTTDPDLLKEVLVNLTRNAVESGASDVRLSAAHGTIAVEDNGPGIADSVKSRLFQPFVTTKAAGTGLGLSIARKLVESLGGELVFLALEPHGTRAEVRLGRGTHTDYR